LAANWVSYKKKLKIKNLRIITIFTKEKELYQYPLLHILQILRRNKFGLRQTYIEEQRDIYNENPDGKWIIYIRDTVP